MTRLGCAAAALGVLLAGAWGFRVEHAADSATAGHEPAVVLFFGDSITLGQGLDEAEAYPAILEKDLADRGVEVRCVNAGVSGSAADESPVCANAVLHAPNRRNVIMPKRRFLITRSGGTRR